MPLIQAQLQIAQSTSCVFVEYVQLLVTVMKCLLGIRFDEWGTNASQWKTTHPWTGVTYFSLLEFPDKPIPEEPQDTLHVQSDEGFVS